MDNMRYDYIEKTIREVAIQIDANKAILFGSFANRTNTSKSDLDVVFIKNTDQRFLDRMDLPMKLLSEKISPMALDVLVYTAKEYNKMIDDGNKFIAGIIKNGKIIYES